MLHENGGSATSRLGQRAASNPVKQRVMLGGQIRRTLVRKMEPHRRRRSDRSVAGGTGQGAPSDRRSKSPGEIIATGYSPNSRRESSDVFWQQKTAHDLAFDPALARAGRALVMRLVVAIRLAVVRESSATTGTVDTSQEQHSRAWCRQQPAAVNAA